MSESLREYHAKRTFDQTPEPDGKGARPRRKDAQGLQFCIQKHDASHLHYDFRLELDGTLKSWAVPKGPSLDPTVRRLAIHVEDHPLDYATFEGSIPQGHYGAGDVIVWDRGRWIPQGDPREGYARGRLKFVLEGEKLQGAWNLVKTHLKGKKEQWFLIKSKDAEARPADAYDVLQALPDSVISERTLTPAPTQRRTTKRRTTKGQGSQALPNARECALPDRLEPALATLVQAPPAGDWRYEMKFDGYRLLARVDGDEVTLFTRNGHDWSARLPRQLAALRKLKLQSAWLDGEVVVANEQGVPDFQALQNAFDNDLSDAIVYYLFDLPYLNGMDLRQVPLAQRRTALATVLKRNRAAALRYSDDFPQPADALLDSVCGMNMEGLIGKRADSAYASGRSSAWIKLKCQRRQEFVVIGYTDPKGSRSGFGALLLGLHDGDSGQLRYAGKVGTGFNEATLRTLLPQLQAFEGDMPELANPPSGAQRRGVHWLRPILLAEVSFAQMTREGAVRHAVFRGLRQDKPAEAITRETASPARHGRKAAPPVTAADLSGQVRITHPDRVIDPDSGVTKRQLAEYYGRIAPWLLPHLQQRPVALVRAPEGIQGELFFQKNAEHLPIAGLQHFSKTQAGQATMVIGDAATLLGAVQMGSVELHTWNANAAHFDRPDRFILDLDPDPTLPWKTMAEATQLTLTLLDELGLRCFLKTSGGKGMHLVVPLTPTLPWEEVKAFSHALVRHMAGLMPERFSAVAGPKNRVGKIFIDYLRNGLGATTVSAYSARARAQLPVSVPVSRDEVATLKGADQWTIATVERRLVALEEDPWAEFFQTRQTITRKMRRQLGLG